MKATLQLLLAQCMTEQGTTPQGALRDVLTDLRHIAHEQRLDFDEAVDGSGEVFDEENDA